MVFSYFNPVKINFNVDFLESLKGNISAKNTLLLSSKSFKNECEILKNNLFISQILLVPPNPQIEYIKEMWKITRGFSNIIALGGGSVIDAAKAFSLQVQFSQFESLLKYGILDSKNTESNIKKSIIYALPTTAGTGSELTPWATIWDKKENKKYSLYLKDLYCKMAIYDISLMQNMPLDLSINTALDALSHAIESIWNKNANPISTQFANYAIKQILNNLPKLVEILESKKANTKQIRILRENLALASINAALAFSNTKTAIAHAISYPLSMRFDMPHGLACSFTLPVILECLLETNSINSNLRNAQKILKPYQKPLSNLFKTLKISTNLYDYNITKVDIDAIFSTLNKRADNFLLDSKIIRDKLLKQFI